MRQAAFATIILLGFLVACACSAGGGYTFGYQHGYDDGFDVCNASIEKLLSGLGQPMDWSAPATQEAVRRAFPGAASPDQ